MAILCITHDRSFVKFLADREIEIGEGINETVPAIQRTENLDAEVLMSAKDLVYQYRYGGLFEKKGAIIGPLNFNLPKGCCLGVIGQSGSGKSTLAQILVGLLPPTSGTLRIEHANIDFQKNKDVDFLRSRVQMVFQDGRGSLHPYFTVRQLLNEVVEFHQRQNGIKSISLLQVLEEFGLAESHLDRKPSSLSGGECLRVCIARSLLLHPGFLVCDESTSALDEDTRDGILNLLRNLMTTHSMSIVFISHDEHVIRMLADIIIVLHEGRVVESGPAPEVINFPTHPVTKKIFSSGATIPGRGHL
jgi:peptide/nickel transport system ATP-binding protein